MKKILQSSRFRALIISIKLIVTEVLSFEEFYKSLMGFQKLERYAIERLMFVLSIFDSTALSKLHDFSQIH